MNNQLEKLNNLLTELNNLAESIEESAIGSLDEAEKNILLNRLKEGEEFTKQGELLQVQANEVNKVIVEIEDTINAIKILASLKESQNRI